MHFKDHKFRYIFALVLIVGLFIGLGAALDSHKAASLPKPVPVSQGPLPVIQPSTQAPAAPPAAAPAPPPAPSTPSMTISQQQAVQSAQSYLNDGSGFSEQGLLQQLTSSYGGGFSNADAQFAINNLNPNWNAQAVEAAQGYMTSQPGWSASSLEQQLTSSYGSGFTQAQADYAVSKVGL